MSSLEKLVYANISTVCNNGNTTSPFRSYTHISAFPPIVCVARDDPQGETAAVRTRNQLANFWRNSGWFYYPSALFGRMTSRPQYCWTTKHVQSSLDEKNISEWILLDPPREMKLFIHTFVSIFHIFKSWSYQR